MEVNISTGSLFMNMNTTTYPRFQSVMIFVVLVDKSVSSVVSEGWSASVEDNEKPVKCDYWKKYLLIMHFQLRKDLQSILSHLVTISH